METLRTADGKFGDLDRATVLTEVCRRENYSMLLLTTGSNFQVVVFHKLPISAFEKRLPWQWFTKNAVYILQGQEHATTNQTWVSQ